ncbi:MAG: hypothetical protein PUE01_11350 [Clostridiaceae bacterium]|nr:hypothetical protein [Clostridiaceae bacterium]
MCDAKKYNIIKEQIMKVNFEKAKIEFLEVSIEEQYEIIEKMAYETESMIVYSFVQYMNKEKENIAYHEISFDILTNVFCHIEGAYQMAFFHNQQLLNLRNNNVKYMEWMLSFYDVKVISKELTINIANKIINIDKNNLSANNMLQRLNL